MIRNWSRKLWSRLVSGHARTPRRATRHPKLSLLHLEERVTPAYVASAATFENLDLAVGGAGVTSVISGDPLTTDDSAAQLSLGSSTFNFYGTTYNSLFVSSNGLITFGSAYSDFDNKNLNTVPSQASIAPLWDDWVAPGTAPYDMVLAQFQSGRLVIEWNEVENVSVASGNTARFQAILELNTGDRPGTIQFNYPDLTVGDTNFDDGKSATVGVKDAGTQATTPNPSETRAIVSFNAANSLVDDGKAVALTWQNTAPVMSALTVNPTSINENQSTTVSGTFTDVNTIDTHTVTINWGDNSPDTVLTPGSGITQTGPGAFSYSAQHQYKDNPTGQANGSFTITVTTLDSPDTVELSDMKTAMVQVNDVAPVVTPPANAMITEGGTYNGSGSFSDVGTLDTSFTATVNYGDGSGDQTLNLSTSGSGGTFNLSHVYADDGSYTVTIKVTDKDGVTGQNTFTVAVSNANPTINSVASNQMVAENALVNLATVATFTDAGFDNPNNPGAEKDEAFTYSIDWGDGTAPSTGSVPDPNRLSGPSAGSFGGQHRYADDGTYTVTVTVADDDGGSDQETFTVTVTNANPTLTVAQDQMIGEGAPLNLTQIGSFSDPGFSNPNNPGSEKAETFTYSINWGDGTSTDGPSAVTDVTNGSPGVNTTGRFGGSHVYADNGTYTVTVKVFDDDTGSDTRTFTVTVTNVNPTLTVAQDQMVSEGATLSLTDLGTITDPGFDNASNPGTEKAETFTYSINWGDGTATNGGFATIDDVGGVNDLTDASFDGSHVYADDGVYTVTVRVADDDMSGNFATGAAGTDFVEKTFTVTVNNVKPTLTVAQDQMATEGATLSLPGIGTFTDPGFDNANNMAGNPPETTETFTYSINWGDGTTADTGSALVDHVGGPNDPTTGSFDGSHVYADDGVYTVTVTVFDDDSGSDQKTFTVTVNNADPLLAATGNQMVNEGTLLDLPNIGSFLDAGFDNPNNPNGASKETFTYSINWGDGTTASTGTATVDTVGSPGVATEGHIDGSHVYADDGIYTVTVTVTDDNGGTAQDTFQVTVNNVNPTLSAVANQMATEGTTLSVTDLGTITDPGFDNPSNPGSEKAETFTYSINWGDGTATNGGFATIDDIGGAGDLTDASFDGSHVYADDGVYTVTVRVADDDMTGNFAAGTAGTDFVEKTFTVTVGNANPVLTQPTNVTNAVEGTTLDLSGAFSFSDKGFSNPNNPGAEKDETFTYTINWGDGTSTDGPSAVTSVTQGQANPLTPTTGTFGGSHVYADDGTYLVTVKVFDDDTGSDTKTFTVKVGNANPTLTVAANQMVNEGALLSVTDLGAVTDPGFDNASNPNGASAETFTYSINWGDGTSASTGGATIDDAGGAGDLTDASFDGSHVYADDGVYTVTVRVADDDMSGNFITGAAGTDFVEKTFTVTVNNVKPTLSVAPNQMATEGAVLSVINAGTFSDPGFDNASNPGSEKAETFTATINWGDGTGDQPVTTVRRTPGQTGTPTTGSFDGSHVYADDGTYTVTVKVFDDDTGSDTKTFTVTVKNASPVLTPTGDQQASLFLPLSIAQVATFLDAGFDNPLNPGAEKAESFTFSVDWGDNTQPTTGTVNDVTAGSAGMPTRGSFGATHTYGQLGTFTVTATVTDDDGGSDTRTFLVTVQPSMSGVTLSSPLAGPAGFQATLPFPLNLSYGPGRELIDSVTVDWGDGTTQTVLGTPGQLTHLYALADDRYEVSVTLRDRVNGSFAALNKLTANVELASDNEGFVGLVYRSLLGRAVDTSGLANWSGLLDRGASPASVVASIAATPEYNNRVVNDLYRLVLGRDADAAGLAGNVSFLMNGGTQRQLTLILLSSDEFFNAAGRTNEGFLRLLYTRLLGRALDESGRANWLGLFGAGLGRDQVTSLILSTDEYRGVQVQSYFGQILGRKADDEGLAQWKANLARLGEEAVVILLASSQEMFQRLASL